MATVQYNVPRGAVKTKDITESVGSLIASGAVEVTIDLDAGAHPREIQVALEAVSSYIRESDWPPV